MVNDMCVLYKVHRRTVKTEGTIQGPSVESGGTRHQVVSPGDRPRASLSRFFAFYISKIPQALNM